jgi:hypothetical protein
LAGASVSGIGRGFFFWPDYELIVSFGVVAIPSLLKEASVSERAARGRGFFFWNLAKQERLNRVPNDTLPALCQRH